VTGEAVAFGAALIETKAHLAHGEFGRWLSGVGLSRRRAERLMHLARRSDRSRKPGGEPPQRLHETGEPCATPSAQCRPPVLQEAE
jgi:hypothetical protein